MNPKDKAKELVDNYMFIYVKGWVAYYEVKECALICVDEILATLSSIPFVDQSEYWNEVKQEINNL